MCKTELKLLNPEYVIYMYLYSLYQLAEHLDLEYYVSAKSKLKLKIATSFQT